MKTIVLFLCCVLALVALSESFSLQIRIRYNGNIPQSTKMYLRGSALGLNWTQGILLTPNATEKYSWTTSLAYSSSEIGTNVSMKVLLNDVTWQIGANSIVCLPSQNAAVDLYPWFFSTAGDYKLAGNVYSPELNNVREIIVYTPPSYYENSLKPMRNILVMHDGQNLFNASTSFAGVAWECQLTVNTLVVEGLMEEIMIIGVYNTPNRNNEYTYSYDPTEGFGGLGDHYMNFLIETMLPYARSHYPRIEIIRKRLGILGSSLGGLISCWGIWTRSSVFGKAGCMSSSFWWNTEDFDYIVMRNYPRPYDVQIYVDSGDAGTDHDDVVQTRQVYNHALKLGFALNQTLFYYLDKGGQHSESYWGKRFHVPMTDLYPPSCQETTPL